MTDRRPTKEERSKYTHILGFKPPFGPYPIELEEMYPLNAEVLEEADDDALKVALDSLRALISENPNADFHICIKSREALE